jgi:Xaa-Pro aminopeptidase
MIRADAPDVVEVPADFPLALADKIRAAGVVLRVPEGPLFFADRYIKTMPEIEKLAEAQRLNEQALYRAVTLLREAEASKDGTLFWRGQVLTSQTVQGEINKRALELGAQAFAGGPIVACGPLAGMPHERGHGPLKAHELIVIDTFPRHANSYWGDLSRTFVKGTPTLWQEELYHAVLSAQELAFGMLKAGVDGKDVDQAVIDFFAARGFRNGVDGKGNPYGYIHSLGHSVGLDLHDPGFGLSKVGRPLPAGVVVSVEPGLYYPTNVNGGVGGVHIEDVVTITADGYHNLTTFPKDKWVIE